MGHAFIRSWQLRAAVVVGVTVTCVVFTGHASAAIFTSNFGATVCANDTTNQQGSCTFTGNGSANFAGKFIDFSTFNGFCQAQASDTPDEPCGLFGLNFSNETGKVTASIAFDASASDLDLCVVRGAGQNPFDTSNVVGCSTGQGATETVTFTVNCTDTHFEVQVLPIDISFFTSPINPFPFTGSTVASSVTTCIAGQGNPPPGGQSAAGGHKVTGGGKTSQSPTTPPSANFNVNVMETTAGFKGKTSISDNTGCRFRSSEIDAVSFHDESKSADIFGKGFFLNDQNTIVGFHATVQDNGQGANTSPPGDIYTIDKCNGGGVVVDGNVTYHIP